MKVQRVLRKGAACALALCLFASGVPVSALGAEVTSGTVSSGSWGLSYTVSEDGAFATITGVVTQGAGTVVIPAQIEGVPVTTIAAEAFLNCPATSVTLPATLTSIKRAAFASSKLQKVTLPASLTAVPNNCFQGCTDLAEVVFEGASIQSIGAYAFKNCSSLRELTIPALTGKGYYEVDGTTTISNAVPLGDGCFAGCSSVKTLTFLGGSKTGAANAFAGVSCVEGMSSLETVVYFCKKASIETRSSASTTNSLALATPYYSIDFYDSEEAVEKGEKLDTVTYLSGTYISSILKGEAPRENAYSDGTGTDYATPPTLTDGRVWGVSYEWDSTYGAYIHTYTVNGETIELTDSFNAVAVDRENLNYGWITSPEIQGNEVTTGTHASMTGALSYYTFYRNLDGTVSALNNLTVCAADGSTLTEGKDYTLEWETARRPYISEVWSSATKTQANEPGYYRVRARGVGEYKDTVTYDVVFKVEDYNPSVTGFTTGAAITDSNAMVVQTGSAPYASEARSVLVNVDNWQAQLVAAGLAGVGGGTVVYDPGPEAETAQVAKAVQAFKATNSTGMMMLGSADEVVFTDDRDSGSAADLISKSKNITPSRCSGATVQELAETVYKQIRDKGMSVWGNTWGTDAGKTAIIASSTRSLNALPIEQYAYRMQAPVFFVGGNGALSATTLEYLGDFDSIVIAGGEDCVSSAVAAKVKQVTGVEPQRLLASSANACENSVQLAGSLGNSAGTIVIASTVSSANVSAAALMAATTNASLYTCSTTADAKYLQRLLTSRVEQNPTSVETVYLVGDFSATAPDIFERITGIWGGALSAQPEATDCYEFNGMLYSVSGTQATLVGPLETGHTSVTVGTVTFDGATYTTTNIAAGALSGEPITSVVIDSSVKSLKDVSLAQLGGVTSISVQSPSITSIPASYFKGLAKLTSVSFAGTVKSVGANAFYGCKALTAAPLASATSIGTGALQGCTSLKSASLKAATSIGASAFQGCTALASLTLGSKLKTIGASAFQGCTKLTKLSATSGKLTTVGKKAFYGCAALKSATVAASSSIGASAFQGCTKLTSATLSSAKLKSIGKKAFYGCKKLKTITIKSTKLKQAKVGASAFKGTVAKAKVKVPKAKLKVYKKLLVKKGLSKKATFKKC